MIELILVLVTRGVLLVWKTTLLLVLFRDAGATTSGNYPRGG
jgi:hypothetical protein